MWHAAMTNMIAAVCQWTSVVYALYCTDAMTVQGVPKNKIYQYNKHTLMFWKRMNHITFIILATVADVHALRGGYLTVKKFPFIIKTHTSLLTASQACGVGYWLEEHVSMTVKTIKCYEYPTNYLHTLYTCILCLYWELLLIYLTKWCSGVRCCYSKEQIIHCLWINTQSILPCREFVYRKDVKFI